MNNSPSGRQNCPTPAKVRYATQSAAERSAHDRVAELRAYECTCSWWHLTSKARVAPATSESVTAQVSVLPDGEFAALVSAEVRGQATAEQAGALRAPAVVDRWLDELRRIQQELNVQFAQRKGDRSREVEAWRARALLVQSGVQDRLREARRLRVAAREAAGLERARLRESGLDPRVARGLAGERAKQRLIAAHRAEFDGLLAEEFEAAGLVLPVRVVRHMLARSAGEVA